MKLEVGQFVRTKNGIIDKVTIDYNGHCASPNCSCKHISCAKNYYDEDKIKKASYNIIDLIEVGDYVNGHKVYDDFRLDTDDFGIDFIEIGVESDKFLNHYIREEDIKSIVTKEQMEQMAYKVEE